MPERETPDRGSAALPDDLFDRLPEPSAEIPSADRTPPAPGSRRARREAAAVPGGPSADDADAAAHDGRGSAAQPSQTEAHDDVPGTPLRARPIAAQAASPAPEPPVQTTAVTTAESSPAGVALEDLFQHESDDAGRTAERKKKRRTGCLVALLIVLVLIGGAVAAGAVVWNAYGDRISDALGWGEPKDWEPGLATGEALVTIEKGDTGAPVSAALHEAGVTRTEDVFYDYLVAENVAITFYPGVYRLQQKMTAEAALAALQSPDSKMENTVGIAEGGTIESSLAGISEGVGIPVEDLERALADPGAYGVDAQSLEGWLFPAVYTFDPGATAEDVIEAMVARTRESLAAAGVPDGEEQRVLTVASIIQREGRTDDFPQVARVIQNRLDQGMKLQMDSTAQYGYGTLHEGVVSSSAEALEDDNEWNTYVRDGLPATPIASPSDAAIDAAMHPADGPWLYFVTINLDTGETQFSETYEEHQAGIEKWHEWCRAHPDAGC